jgi:ABC-2 type transport system permease protein
MQAFVTLVRRELGGYFVSMTGYVLISATLLLLGASFALLAKLLNTDPADVPLTELFYKAQFFWLVLLLVSPLITMRTFAQEKHTGTFETLMTTPVGDLQVVLAKFTGVFLFYLLLWAPLWSYPWILHRFTGDAALLDWGPMGTTYLGIALFGAAYMAMGCFASALTRSQIIAAMIALAIGMVFFLASFLTYIHPARADWQSRLYAHLSMVGHMQDFTRGVVDSRPVVFYLSLTVFFLFLTWKVVESRRWKG